jgi:hypothetical protein
MHSVRWTADVNQFQRGASTLKVAAVVLRENARTVVRRLI